MATFEDVRRDLKGGQEEALLRKLWLAAGGEQGGAEGLKAILDGTSEIVVREAVQKLFDGTFGRRIPPLGMKGVVDAHPDFRLVQPTIVYADRLARITRHLAAGQEFISVTEFEARCRAVLETLGGNTQAANLQKCPYFPFALPAMQIADYGTTLDEQVLPAVGRAYGEQFSDRRFVNHRAGTLAGQVTVVESSRHDRFIKALDKGPVCGVYFPCLQGFPLEGDIQQMDGLPDEFLLAGAIDTAAVEIMYPDVVARDYHTPGLDCAALRWRGLSLFFWADGGELGFDCGDLYAGGLFAGGLVVLG